MWRINCFPISPPSNRQASGKRLKKKKNIGPKFQTKNKIHSRFALWDQSLIVFVICEQVDYILGDNPMGLSYMVGYGQKFPRRIHHRGSSVPSVSAHPSHIGCKEGSRYFLSPNPNPNLLVGAVVGGPNVTDAFPDSRPYFQQSEPTTYINAPLVGLLGYFSAHSTWR